MYGVPEGFEAPVFKGPLKPRLSLGAPRDFTFTMIGGFALGLLYKLWAILPLTIILEGIAIWGTYQDEKWFQKVLRAMRYKRYYKP